MENHDHTSAATLDQNRTDNLVFGHIQEPYYDRLMYAATGSFTNMIKVGNVIDHAIKNDKIDLGESSSRPRRGGLPKKKEEETHAVYQQNPPN